MTIFGHDRILGALRERLPSVSLFFGPRSVGKWSSALELAQLHGVEATDLRVYRSLSAASSREIVEFLGYRSLMGSKAVVCRLDGASEQAVNGLLKILEEPPPSSYFILCASERPLLTVTSRAARFGFGYLREDEVASVLVARLGWTDDDAEWAAARSGGQVAKALEAADLDASKQAVLSLLKGAADGDVALVSNALAKFGHDPENPRRAERLLAVLRQWSIEARTDRWRVFSPGESYGLHREPTIVDRVMKATTSGARPRVAARAALMPVAVARGAVA